MTATVEFRPVQIEAMIRWLSLGTTSLTNPVLAFGMTTFLEPLGIFADWVEFDATSADLIGARARLHRPVFRVSGVSAALEGDHARTFAPLKEHVGSYQAEVSCFGELSIKMPSSTGEYLLAEQLTEELQRSGKHALLFTREAAAHLTAFYQKLGPMLASDTPFAAQRQAEIVACDYRTFAVQILDHWSES